QITGTLRKILAVEGAVVPVGAPIAVIGSPDEDISTLLLELSPTPTAGGAALPEAAPPEAPRPGAAPPSMSASSSPREPPSVSPRARETAGEGGIPWESLELPGTGFEGMVVERDILAYLESEKTPPSLATPLAAKMAADL